MIERRTDDRIPDEIPALFAKDIGDPDIQVAQVVNLSGGGACATVETAPPVGAAIYVGFFLAGIGGVPVIARMRVAWTKRDGLGHVVGLAFMADGPAQRDSVERMRDYISARRRALLGAFA
jgi:hypothetical protein